jgi:AraC-like DNA-binding protein
VSAPDLWGAPIVVIIKAVRAVRYFQELAMSTVMGAKLIGWGARALYLGPSLGLTPHRNATAVLAMGLDQPLHVAADPADRNTPYRTGRSVLIPPNSLHHLRIGGGRMAFLYLDPLSEDLAALRIRMQEVTPRAAFGLSGEIAVIEVLSGLAENRLAARDGRRALDDLLGLGRRARRDARVVAALRQLYEEPHKSHALKALAKRAGLSPSRFLHLFKAETGVPLRRYRIWNRMGAAVRSSSAGRSLTEAAHAAGFASSAHFSAAFRDMFGMRPSALFKALERVDG